MKTNKVHARHGFTLIEMIGVLAVIAILAAILAPKVFEAIQTSKVNNASSTITTLSQALNDHFALKGKFTNAAGTDEPSTTEKTNFVSVLQAQGLVDKAPFLKIGSLTTSPVIIVEAGLATTIDAAADNAAYDLDNDVTVKKNDAGGSQYTLSFVITGVAAADAKALNDKIDGVGQPFAAGALEAVETKGKVKYTAPSGGLTTVRVYLAHR